MQGSLEFSRYTRTGQAGTGRLSVPVLAAREWSLRGLQSPPDGGAPLWGRKGASPCWWALLRRGGQKGECEALWLRLHPTGGDGQPPHASG